MDDLIKIGIFLLRKSTIEMYIIHMFDTSSIFLELSIPLPVYFKFMMSLYPTLPPIVKLKKLPIATLGRKGSFCLPFSYHSRSLREVWVGKQRGAKAEAVKEHWLLSCSHCSLTLPSTGCSGMAQSTLGWTLDPPRSVINMSP